MDSTEAVPRARLAFRSRCLPAVALLLGVALGAGAAEGQEPAPAQPVWEGAVGVLFRYGPAYQGSESSRLSLRPGLFLRYGRYSATTTGGFVTRSNDEVPRGVSAELVARDDLRVSLSLRLDGGRDDGDDPMLQGLGNVRATVRGRLSAVKDFGSGWKLSAGLSPDVLGRDGGIVLDSSLSYEWRLSPTLRANAGVSLTAGDRRYMQSYFGVTAEQRQRSGHPVYEPSAGLRDLGFGFGLRADLGPHWLGFVNASTSRLQGPTLDSPLTRRRDTWGVGGGLAWRF
ncbi:MipA/OmpV family protein [Aquabacterium sp.]|uniref:MipA/OmpV family protein n=1 Tax=Aquabacterium sp. TaxID=1872578 RepID=UPI002CF22C7D|nr:MipA/OmpV family protein [Aquabacterium sp.]HSW09051.1 MipA/OmpV family protein [Aquabacterium sp.]